MQSSKGNLISVIIPVYNAEKFIEKCVRSIQAQTYTNLEIILVNDGSSDNSGVLCDKLAKADNRIKVIHKQNGGTSAARNIGIDEANGKFITFVDHDDYIEADMYERMHNRIDKTEADVCMCGFSILHDNYRRIVRIPQTYQENRSALSSVCYFKDLVQNFRARYVLHSSIWNKLYKKELISKHRIRFQERTGYNITGEDCMFATDCCAVADGGIVFVDSSLYNYVYSISSESKNMDRYEDIEFLDYIKKIMLAMLPDEKSTIERLIDVQTKMRLVTAIHVANVSKMPPPRKLNWSTVLDILRYSGSKEERISTLLIYFFPAPIYRLAYKLYSKGTI